jgi:hypothetical protein
MDPIDARKKRKRYVVRAAPLHGRVQHLSRRFHLSTLERGDAVVKQLFGFALLLRHSAARAIDVRTRACMIAIEKQRPRPDVDRLSVIGGEILIEAGNEETLDFGVTLGVAVDRGPVLVDRIRAERIGHARAQIMRQNQL